MKLTDNERKTILQFVQATHNSVGKGLTDRLLTVYRTRDHYGIVLVTARDVRGALFPNDIHIDESDEYEALVPAYSKHNMIGCIVDTLMDLDSYSEEDEDTTITINNVWIHTLEEGE